MFCVNEVRLLGNLGRDPEIRTFQSGDRIATLNICTTDKWRDRATGEMREHSEWHRVVVREPGSVEYLERNASKGSPVYVEGASRTRKVSSPNADDKYFTEIHASRVTVFQRMRDGGTGQADERHEKPSSQAPSPSRGPSPAPQTQTPRANRQQDQEHRPQGYGTQSQDGYPDSQFEPDDAFNGPALRF